MFHKGGLIKKPTESLAVLLKGGEFIVPKSMRPSKIGMLRDQPTPDPK